MAKRIKRVFSNADQVIHIWANQSQNDARCRNAYFEGNRVWSYGSHHELGRLVEFNGVKLALINDTGYSVTTRGHISSAYSAVSHMFRLKMRGINESREAIETALLRVQNGLINELFDVFNRRTFTYTDYMFKSDYGTTYNISEFNGLCRALGFEHLAVEFPNDLKELILEHSERCKARELELNSPEHLAKREAAALKRNAKAIEKWRGGGQLTNQLRNLTPMILRVKGNEVETSRGAQVSLDHALRLLKLVDARKAKAGERVGHFKLDQVTDETVKIGCHTININEARSVLAPMLNAVAA